MLARVRPRWPASARSLHLRTERSGVVEVLQLGHPDLLVPSGPILNFQDPDLVRDRARLHDALAAFRRDKGFGRAIAAPQIGVARRMVAVNLGEGPRTLHNPEVVERSRETFRLWDDCMSFPDLLCLVERHERIRVRFQDDEGRPADWDIADRLVAELIQHELDHLDGVLAVHRALRPDLVVSRADFARDHARLAALADVAPQAVVVGSRLGEDARR